MVPDRLRDSCLSIHVRVVANLDDGEGLAQAIQKVGDDVSLFRCELGAAVIVCMRLLELLPIHHHVL